MNIQDEICLGAWVIIVVLAIVAALFILWRLNKMQRRIEAEEQLRWETAKKEHRTINGVC